MYFQQDNSDPNDKFSVRAEKPARSSRQQSHQHSQPPSVRGGHDPHGGSTHSLSSSSVGSGGGNRGPLTAAELRLNPGVIKRVPPTGESTNETTTPPGGGQQQQLGMAPPLSKLIMSSNLQVVQVEHHSDSDSSRATPKQRQHQV